MSPFQARLQEALGTAYQIERELPLGGLGRLFLATEIASGRQVSVQALPPDLAARVDLGRFRAAVDRVSRLKHPGILPLIAANTRDGVVFCVWPHPSGESLRYRLIRDGGLGTDETLQVLHDVADALAYGHAENVYHGDLRPDNIYLENGRAFVAEFGIRTALNAALGSEGGMDARADVHALAVAGQQMAAGRSGATGTVIARALSIDPGEQFADAAAFRDALGVPPSAMRRRRHWRLGVAAAIAVVLGVILVRQTRQDSTLDPDLIAVVPFDVLDAGQAVWREGMVTVLSANLDGAGPLHTVSPSVVIRRWGGGNADAPSAAALARRTGARLALYGRLVRAGGDSMRVTATLVDAEAGAAIAEIRLADSRLDRLADSLTVGVLRELGRTRAIGAVRTASLGTGSMAALKAFLVGEQHYRRSEWDSALANYQHAIEVDSTFALALYRAGLVLGWQSNSSDSLSNDYLLRAGSHNRGLPPRDSLLVLSESLSAALDDDLDPRYWSSTRRVYAVTEQLVHRYPRDPEGWYEHGDVRYHYPAFSSLREMRESFDHAITLDTAYAPAYLHQIEIALRLGDRPAATRYLRRYLALRPKDVEADGVHLAGLLLDPATARSAQVRSILDTASADLLVSADQYFRGWADTSEVSILLARELNPGRRSSTEQYRDPALLRRRLASALAYHGHLHDAAALGSVGAYAAAAWAGGVGRDSVATAMARSLKDDDLYPASLAVRLAPWWGSTRDTASLHELARRADSLARGAHPLRRAFGRHVADAARAFAMLARRDSMGAIRGLMALPDTACTRCVLYTITLAELLNGKEMDAQAARVLARDAPGWDSPTNGFWELYRARLATRRGDRRAAVASYRFVHDVWLHGDSILQPYVREAHEALVRANERD